MIRQPAEGDDVENRQNGKTRCERKFLISRYGSGTDETLELLMEGYSKGPYACAVDTCGN
jgi:hypothetical protein